MHILVTGGTGFIGTALVSALVARGDQVTVLTRRARPAISKVTYITSLAQVNDKVDGVINLAGASLADKRWSRRYKKEMFASRVNTTEQLTAWMNGLDTPVQVFLSGSAIGYYGSSDGRLFSEQSEPGAGFSAELCKAWEQAAQCTTSTQTRVVLMRLGVVFDAGGGALTEMLRSFKMGVGSWVGSGRQWLSWIHRSDAVRAMLFLIDNPAVTGPVNLVAPRAVTHRQFASIASRVKPVFVQLGVPGLALRLLLGEMANELLLSGQQVEPQVLATHGFDFTYPELEQALRASL